jgi:hypothetical protein
MKGRGGHDLKRSRDAPERVRWIALEGSSIVLSQRDAEGSGALVRTRVHNVSVLERTVGTLEPRVSVMNFKINRWDPSN